jgi:hypothetical protein
MLCDAVTMAHKSDIKAIVIMSDDRNLAPIVPLVKRISRNPDLRVIHVKMDERTKTYDGAEEIVISKEAYLAHLDPVDRLAQAAEARRNVLLQDIGEIEDKVREATGHEPQFNLRPEQAEGRYVLKSTYWSAFREDDGALAIYENETLPFSPVLKQTYRISDRGKALEAAPERLRPMESARSTGGR